MTRYMTIGLGAAAVLLGGCAQPGAVTGAGAVLPEDAGSAGYLDRISSRPQVSENDAFRGMLYLLEGEDAQQTFAQRVAELRDRDVVSGGWDFQADRPLSRGKLAYMIYQACDVPGGVTLTLFGPSPRYCLRELQYRGMMTAGSSFGPVTGTELVAVLSRADAYLQTGQMPDVLAGRAR